MAAGPLLVASQTDDARLVAMAGAAARPAVAADRAVRRRHGRPPRPAYGRGDREPRAQPSSWRCSAPRSPPATCPSRSCWSRSSRWAWPRCSPTRPRAPSSRCSSTSRDLGIANSRMQAGFLTANQLVGPPVGAFLFAAGMVWPFASQLVCVLLGVVLVSRIGSTRDQVRDSLDTHVRQDIVDGIRWLWGHAADPHPGDRHPDLQHHVGRRRGRSSCSGRSTGCTWARWASAC